MITHLHSTTITVSDQEEALRFYVDTLGWEKRGDNQLSPEMRWLTVAPKGAQTELALLRTGEASQACGISLITEDIDAAYTDLSAKGVQFKQAPETMPWGDRATWFSDPFGNEYFLVQQAK
jgi:uncharacterized glyoxalase superfamily protein PhnB